MDLTSPASQFKAASSFGDVGSVDENLQTISAVERTWRLPSLPDAVKLDLAAFPAPAVGVESFLRGLDRDFAGESDDDDLIEDLSPEPPKPSFEKKDFEFGRSSFDQLRVIFADVAQEPKPTDPSEDAVKRFKLDAIDRGLLAAPEDGVVDSTWSRDLNSVRYEMAFDDYDRTIGGDRIGAVPVETVVNLLDDWTSPAGLLAAATELDLWFDFDQIGSEASTWGDKWRAVGKSENPWDFGKNLLDAATGPIDDVAVPILNWALIATGVGASSVGARTAFLGTRLGLRMKQSHGFLGTLYSARGLVVPSTAKQLALPSMTASRLLRSQGAGRHAAGQALAAWRGLTPVVKTKQVVGLGMRVGALAQVENNFLPNYQGRSLGEEGGPLAGVNESLRSINRNPAMLPFELMVAPQNIFNTGTFLKSGGEGLNVISRATRAGADFIGSGAGRAAIGAAAGATVGWQVGDSNDAIFTGAAAGAVGGLLAPQIGRALSTPVARELARPVTGAAGGAGYVALFGDEDPGFGDYAAAALAGATIVSAGSWMHRAGKSGRNAAKSGRYIGWIGETLQHSSFERLASSQRIANSTDRAVRASLINKPEELDRYERLWEKHQSFLPAYAEFFGMGADTQKAATQITFLQMSSFIDDVAATWARSYAGADNAGFEMYRHTVRNKIIAQLREINVVELDEMEIVAEVAKRQALRKVAQGQKGYQTEYRKLVASYSKDADSIENALSQVEHHNKVARDLQRQLLSPERLDDLDPDVANLLRAEGEGGVRGVRAMTDTDTSMEVFEAYIAQADGMAFDKWDDFVNGHAAVNGLAGDGVLDPAQFKAAENYATGALVNAMNEIDNYPSYVVPPLGGGKVTDAILEGFAAGPAASTRKMLKNEAFSPLAFTNETGRSTLAKKATKVKSEVRTFRNKIKELANIFESAENLSEKDLRTLDAYVATHFGTELSDLTVAQVKAVLKKAAELKGLNKGSVETIHQFARRVARNPKIDVETLTGAGVAKLARENLEEVLNAEELWAPFNLHRFVRTSEGTLATTKDAARARLRQLAELEQYTAAELDVDALVEFYEAAGDLEKAKRVRDVATSLDEKGYKIVHGVEFLMPIDLSSTGAFADMSAKTQHGATLGNFFQGRMPAVARAATERRHRAALRIALADQLGPKWDSVDPAVRDAQIGDMIADLHEIVEQGHKKSDAMLDNLSEQGFWQRASSYATSMSTPRNIEDLRPRQKLVLEQMRKFGWTEDEAKAAWKATANMRDQEWKDLGLYAIEARLRSQNQMAQGLKYFNGGARGAYAGAVPGAFFGMAAGYNSTPEGGSEMEQYGRTVAGGFLGGVAGAAVGGVLGAGVKKFDMVEKASMKQYGYLVDMAVRMRDTMRFTLSPFFDISRYTEGLMLNQMGGPLRKADGSRVIMNLNGSPSGTRKALRKVLLEEGKSPAQAKRMAADQFKVWRTQFRAAAQGDFDPEVLDSTGKWFTQVGIMGFNPTDWMAGSFAQLRLEGFDPEESYRAVREMYTYGTQGRSAAEMSTNFIFFPFSFQKKIFKHMGEFLTDDIGRSILIHDAYKAWQTLDEHYDLDDRFRDHLPVIEQMNRLNMFNYGISPGQLGGINAPFVMPVVKASMGLFGPQGAKITNAVEASEYMDTVRRLLPVYNDINWLLEDLKDQGHVIVSPQHQTRKADIRDGYQEWNDYKKELDTELDQLGLNLSDLQNKPWLADRYNQYKMKKSELAMKYPEWRNSRVESVQNTVSLNMEKSDRSARIEAAVLAGTPLTELGGEDQMFAVMEETLREVEQVMRWRGYEVGGNVGWDDAPTEAFEQVQAVGLDLLEQDPRFSSIWASYYEKDFGLLEAKI